MDYEDAEQIFINPYYAINISPALIGEHEPMATKEEWIRVNARLMNNMGKEEWLRRLLAVLESGDTAQ